ncbi:zinc ABC transporter, periplasmic-binding protein ZnuA [Lachnospiraceae bacterium KM106-2]|nr:zinc ABC transporter, periplasmic-binding protein ZnuA [Lachnospiraceae bacterium KM106-2]
MKASNTKKVGILLSVMCVLVIISMGLTRLFNSTPSTNSDKKIRVVTSFYPVYIAAMNVTKDMDNIELTNLAGKQTGCLHDYTLTTADMKVLEDADVFIMNGGGMESFVDDILKAYPKLTIIDTSEGITMLEGSAHSHEHSHDDSEEDSHEHSHDDSEEDSHEHSHDDSEEDSHEEEHSHEGEQNAHVWLNPDNYVKQIENMKNGLIQYDSANKTVYEKNASEYEKKVADIKTELTDMIKLGEVKNSETIIFHDSFEYLLDYLGIEVVDSIEIEKDTSLSAGDVAEIINEVKEHKIKVLFTEKQFSATIATRIGKETGAKVYVLDSLVSGDYDRNEYLTGMKENIKVLKEALYQ